MPTHSSILAWRIPGTEEPSGLLSVGSHRVGHDWSDLAAVATAAACEYWKSFQVIPMYLPTKSENKIWPECCVCGQRFATYYDGQRAFLVAQMVKNLPAMQETWVQSLGWEDSLEKEMATHSSILALKIPWTEELGAGYCPWGCKELGMTEWLHFHFCSGEYFFILGI